jgi:RND family efflux transporter MFP subunit
MIKNKMKKGRMRGIGLFALFLLSGMLFVSCSKKEEQAPVEEAARPVRTMILQGGGEGIVKVYPAKTDAQDTVDVSFEVAGKVVELPIERGMRVERDQILAKLDDRDYQNDLAAKKAEWVKAQAELARYRKLYEDDVVSLQDLQIRERDLQVAEANMKIAEKAVQDTVLKAPFAGVVATKYVDNFQSVQAKSPVARIQNNEAIQAVINVPERDMTYGGRAALEKAAVRFDSFPSREFDLTLKEFETEADPVTQTFEVKFIMPNPSDVKILPGMSANVTLQFAAPIGREAGSSFVIPSAAVVSDTQGKPFVWIVDPKDQTVRKREVVLGEVTGTADVRITEGLQPGEVIAVSGIYQLREGMKVQPKEMGAEMTR